MPRFEKGSDVAKVHMQKIRDIAKAKREALKNVFIEEPQEQEEKEEPIEFKEEANSEVSEEIEVEVKPKTMRKPRAPKVKQDIQVVKAPKRAVKKIIIEEDEEEEVEVVYKPKNASKPKTIKVSKKEVEKEPEPFNNPLLSRRYSRI